MVNLLKERDFYLPRAEELIVEESIFSTYELENLNPSALLFQTGYLTIKDYDIETNEYVLSYPNKEVKYSFLEILYKSYVNGGDREERFLELGRALRKGDVDRFIEVAKSIFSGIAYSVGSKINEANFHTLFYLMVNAGGTPADIELLTSDGRIDMVVKLKDKIYIMEFKCNQSAEKAINQIKDKMDKEAKDNIKDIPKEGYVAKISIYGDENYDIYLVVPEEKLSYLANYYFGDDEYDAKDLTNEIANQIIGNAKIIAAKKNVNFDISVPEFLGKFDKNIKFDDILAFKFNGGKAFYILFKGK